MSDPSERLSKVIAAYTPSKVVFKPILDNKRLYLMLHVVEPGARNIPPDDAALHAAFTDVLFEAWDTEKNSFTIRNTVEELFNRVKQVIFTEYVEVSPRCLATKRKTNDFLREIMLDKKHLANYLLQLFVTIKADGYENKSRQERIAIVEPLEALRRTYGKRTR